MLKKRRNVSSLSKGYHKAQSMIWSNSRLAIGNIYERNFPNPQVFTARLNRLRAYFRVMDEFFHGNSFLNQLPPYDHAGFEVINAIRNKRLPFVQRGYRPDFRIGHKSS